MSNLDETIGRVWDEVGDRDWSGWYPMLEVRHVELIVVGLIEADRQDLSDLVPILYRNGMIFVCEAGDQDGFMLKSEYERFHDDAIGGAA